MNRWLVLAGFGLLAACTQLLWLSYAFIEMAAHRAMDSCFHLRKVVWYAKLLATPRDRLPRRPDDRGDLMTEET